MEFRFNLNDIFKEPFVEVGSSLIPPGFTGDKRALWDTQSKITQIVNAIGEASARAQGLSKPITTADRLRNSEHKLYLLLDPSSNNGKGAVTGMLKTGEKGLYVFDREGQHYQVSPPCILDFYIHESRQRAGHGKGLFEHMLQRQQIEPVKMAIDRPSDKLLGFLHKHYGLHAPVKQMNNFVVYDGFFPRSSESPQAIENDKSHITGKKQSANGLQHGVPSSPYGRYGAPRPPCSMGQIIHNDSAVIKRNQEPTGIRSEPVTNIQGQYNMYNSNQMPAWLATQSVPNMSYSYVPNQQNYAPAPQYPQFIQNHSVQYPPSSGDHAIDQQMQHKQAHEAQSQHVNAQNASQNYQQAYHNYARGQGDATNQSQQGQDVTSRGEEPTHAYHSDQTQLQQVCEVQGDQGRRDQNVFQGQSQMFTYQGQTYFYNPQTQQYYIIPGGNQQNLVPNQQVYYNQSQMPADTQPGSLNVPYGPQSSAQHHREPLRPQNLDGTVRRVQQSVSAPVNRTRIQGIQNMPMMVHGTMSAPISYQHQQAMASPPPSAGLGQTYVDASASPVLNQNQGYNVVNPQNNGVIQEAFQPQYRATGHAGDQPSGNIENLAPIAENTAQTPQAMTHTPQNTNVNQMMAQSPIVNQPLNDNQMPVEQIQYFNQVPSVPQVVSNAQNSNLQHQQQPNMAYNQTALHNQANPGMPHQNQPVSQTAQSPQDGNQNVGAQQHSNDENMTVVVESTHSRIHNVPSAQVLTSSPPKTNQIAALFSNEPPNQEIQNIQQVSPMDHPRNTPFQQQQMMHQHSANQPQNLTNQQISMHLKQNENVARQQPMGGGEFAQERNLIPQNVASNVNTRTNNNTGQGRYIYVEDKLSEGYPPQHHERPAQNSTPKADRPQSLDIETTEDLEIIGVVQMAAHEPLHGNYEDADSLDGDRNDLEGIEEDIEKIAIALKENAPFSKSSRSPGIEAAGIVTPGRNTPGLTDQGYFDLKFYHNKLW